jgi:5,10-methylene-tetrahydrofolate dehydrogenase/methenyl tetrahydrofolate cyclohydrolase
LFIFFHGNKFLIKDSASMSSQKKVRGLMKEGPLVQMLDRQRVQQAAADEAKKLVDAAALASERLVDATKEAEETATAAAAAAAAAALSSPEEAQVRLSGSTATAAC